MPVDEAQDVSVDATKSAVTQARSASEAVAGEATAITLAADALTRAWRASGPAAAETAIAQGPPPMVLPSRAEVHQPAIDEAVAIEHPLEVERLVDAPASDSVPSDPMPGAATDDPAVDWHVDAARLPDEDASTPVAPPVYRPRRARAAVVVLLLMIALGVPATVYLMRHPETLAQLSLFLDRAMTREPASQPTTAAQPDLESAATSATAPATTADTAPNDGVPPPSAASKTGETAAAATGSSASSTTVASTVEPTASTAPPASAAPPPTVAASSLAPATEARDAKRDGRSASTTARRATRSRNEPREARTPLPTQRETSPAMPVSPQVQCTPAVAALGLCNP
ncbi:MAG TPA: hypothetical protein VNG69_11620 [Casimicrobiaceae bacterium]|nr:hypothetical protein [Casimicrobiaceae bacterium]